jgi:hypothetical protein
MLSQKLATAAKLLVLGAALAATGTPALAADPTPAAVNVAPATGATWKSIDGNLQTLESLVGAGKIGDLGEIRLRHRERGGDPAQAIERAAAGRPYASERQRQDRGKPRDQQSARLGALDPKTGNVYLPSGKLGPPVPPNPWPTVLPGSFEFLVVFKK